MVRNNERTEIVWYQYVATTTIGKIVITVLNTIVFPTIAAVLAMPKGTDAPIVRLWDTLWANPGLTIYCILLALGVSALFIRFSYLKKELYAKDTVFDNLRDMLIKRSVNTSRGSSNALHVMVIGAELYEISIGVSLEKLHFKLLHALEINLSDADHVEKVRIDLILSLASFGLIERTDKFENFDGRLCEVWIISKKGIDFRTYMEGRHFPGGILKTVTLHPRK